MTTRYGLDIDDWNPVKEEMQQAMISRAKGRGMIRYPDLYKQVPVISRKPRSYALAAMLGEISTDQDAVGRGMLTVILVHTSCHRHCYARGVKPLDAANVKIKRRRRRS